MKNTLVLTSTVFALGYAVVIAAQFAGLVSFNVFGLPSLIGGAIASAVVGLVFADYTRRPRFRVRSPGQAASFASTRAQSQAGDPVTMWTYTTRRR